MTCRMGSTPLQPPGGHTGSDFQAPKECKKRRKNQDCRVAFLRCTLSVCPSSTAIGAPSGMLQTLTEESRDAVAT